MSADLVAFILGLGGGAGAMWWHLRDRIKPKEKTFTRCSMVGCDWSTKEAVPVAKGQKLVDEHIRDSHGFIKLNPTQARFIDLGEA